MDHKKLPSRYGEDYVAHWNYTTFEGKTILDLGADYGSTASFFLEHGAKKIIAVEGREDEFRKLQENYMDDPSVTCIYTFIMGPNHIKKFIDDHKPDLVKADIEMAENYMLEMDNETLRQVPEYLIETHRYEDLAKFWIKFRDLKYKFKICWLQTSTCANDEEALVIYARKLKEGESLREIYSDHGILCSR